MTSIAPTIQAFFTDRLAGQLQASPRTIASYRDTLRLLLRYTHQQTGKPPSALDWEDLNEELISRFLEHLETVRGNAAKTRNLRLTAIRSLFTYASLRHPEHANTIARVLAIPPKRHQQRTITYLSAPEAAALIDAPDGARWEGRRDRTLLTLAIYTGLRVSELTGLDCGDIALGTGANVRCRQGKGRKQRAVPLITPVRPLLAAWLAERAGQPGDPLFPTRTGRRLSTDAVAQRVSTHAATAATACPSSTASTCTPTPSATAARCRCCKPASTPPSSPSGSDTRTCAPPTPTSTPTSRSRRKRSRSSPHPTSNPAATNRPTRSSRSSKACDYADKLDDSRSKNSPTRRTITAKLTGASG